MSQEEAGRVIDDMERIVQSRWRDLVLKHGVCDCDCEAILSAFDYAGSHDHVMP